MNDATGSNARFIVRKGPIWGRDIEIFFGIQHPDGSVDIANPITLTRTKPDEIVSLEQPMLRFDDQHELQCLTSLMDQLWTLGIRPSDIGTPGHLEATKSHLADMRKLVSKTYGVELC